MGFPSKWNVLTPGFEPRKSVFKKTLKSEEKRELYADKGS